MAVEPRLEMAPASGDWGQLAERVAAVCNGALGAGPAELHTARRADSRLITNRVRPAFAEAFRLLALNVVRLAETEGVHSLLVMSAYPGDGRTLAAANLAAALAGLGRRVAAVDCDTHRPALARFLGVSVETATAPGDDGTLAGVRPTDVSGLALVPTRLAADRQPDVPALQALLGALRPVTDCVVIDSPPCQRTADAYALAPLVDGVLYVVRRRRQDVAAQRSIQAQLQRLGARVLGAVFNDR